MTLEESSELGRDNVIGVMRLLIAGVVIVSHAFPLGGWGLDPTGYLTHSQVNLGFLALLGFLVMSGYLVTTSARRAVINGSIWSLYFEVRLYLTVAVLAALKLLDRARWVVPLGAGVASASIFLVDRAELAPVIHGLFGPGWGPQLAAVFLLGATAAVYPQYIKLDGRLAATAAVVSIGTMGFGGFFPIGFVGYAYVILWLCFRPPGWAGRLTNRHDISYGVYLYAFPIQLLLTAGGVPKLGFLPYVGITVALTVPLALVSWLVIERPVLRLKNRGPGRIGRRVPTPAALSKPQPAAEAS